MPRLVLTSLAMRLATSNLTMVTRATTMSWSGGRWKTTRLLVPVRPSAPSLRAMPALRVCQGLFSDLRVWAMPWTWVTVACRVWVAGAVAWARGRAATERVDALADGGMRVALCALSAILQAAVVVR